MRTGPSGISSPTQQLSTSTLCAETPQGHPREKHAALASRFPRSRRLGRPAQHQRLSAESLADRTSPPARALPAIGALTASNRDGCRHVTNVFHPRRRRRRLYPPPAPPTDRVPAPMRKTHAPPSGRFQGGGGCCTREPRDTPRPLGSRAGGWSPDALAQ